LEIQRKVEEQVLAALGRDTPNWRVLNACPPCGYEACYFILQSSYSRFQYCLQLEEEPYLKFRRMICVDGNNSLKRFARVGERAIADTRTFQGDYYLSPAFVDRFKDEVGTRARPTDDASNAGLHNDGPGLCSKDWKAAGELGTWGVFQESGVFASACRHGFILWLVDMIRSGEL
jgi:hypothetical protein